MGIMKMKMCKFVSMIVVLVMTFVCAIPAFAAAPSGQVGYAVNRNGETYGNNLKALEIGYEADLIFAEGEDGVQGYVRARDLDDSVESPNEAVNPTADEWQLVFALQLVSNTVVFIPNILVHLEILQYNIFAHMSQFPDCHLLL